MQVGRRLAADSDAWLPKLVLSPSLAAVFVCIYGFIAFTVALSFTDSRFLPSFDEFTLRHYLAIWENPRWLVAVDNIAIFGILYIGLSLTIGLILAILLDQRVRAEGVIRTLYLYPMALSFIVTGVAWQWMLNPGLGLERVVRELGWASFEFRWLVDTDMAIYTVVIAGVWQASGFTMAMFLAGLRSIDSEILKAAAIDGAGRFRTYWTIVLPTLRPVFVTATIIQAHLAIKSYDLVVALTRGGPGFATELPSTFMYSTTFTRNQMALGATSAVVMLTTVAALIVPYLYSELRREVRRGS